MTRVAFLAVAILTVAPAGFAADRTWSGTITDTMCARSHQSNIEHALERSGKKMTNQECTVGCVMHRGQRYVLVVNGKVFQIANQEYSGLAVHAAQAVTVTGRLDGDAITVSQIAGAAAHK